MRGNPVFQSELRRFVIVNQGQIRRVTAGGEVVVIGSSRQGSLGHELRPTVLLEMRIGYHASPNMSYRAYEAAEYLHFIDGLSKLSL